MSRVLVLEGKVKMESCVKLIHDLRRLAGESNDDIVLFINSPGGHTTAGFAVSDAIKMLSCDVRTVGYGKIMSAAALIFTSGTKGKRVIAPSATLMFHQPSGQIELDNGSMEIVKREKEHACQVLANNMGKTIGEIESSTEWDLYLNAMDAVEYGAADTILSH